MNFTQMTWKGFKTRFLTRDGEFRRNPGQSWTLVLSFLGIGILVVLGVGYVTYLHSVRNDSEMPPVVSHSALRTADVKSIIEAFQQKKELMNTLLSDKPTFPSPLKGAVSLPKEEKLTPSLSTSTIPAPLP